MRTAVIQNPLLHYLLFKCRQLVVAGLGGHAKAHGHDLSENDIRYECVLLGARSFFMHGALLNIVVPFDLRKQWPDVNYMSQHE